ADLVGPEDRRRVRRGMLQVEADRVDLEEEPRTDAGAVQRERLSRGDHRVRKDGARNLARGGGPHRHAQGRDDDRDGAASGRPHRHALPFPGGASSVPCRRADASPKSRARPSWSITVLVLVAMAPVSTAHPARWRKPNWSPAAASLKRR